MATVRKNRGRWIADFRDQHGRRRMEAPQGPFANSAQEKIAAQALLTKRLAEVARGDHVPERQRPTFSELCDAYLASKVNIRPTTLRSYRSLIDLYLRPYFGNRRIHHISASDIERFRSELVNGLPPTVAAAFAAQKLAAHPKWSQGRAKQEAARKKPGVRTINKALTVLVMMFNYAARHRWVDFNPAEYVERLRDSRGIGHRPIDDNILTPHEVRRLIDATDAGRDRLLIQLAAFTGMRQGEILGLQWGDVDWERRQIYVRRSWKEGQFTDPKTRSSARRVDLPDFLVLELKRWRLACPKGEFDLIVPNGSGNPESHANVLQRCLYPSLRRAGLRKIRFHDLRHTFASLLLANGEDIVRVSRLLGHVSPHVTLTVYSHMLPKEHYGSADRLSQLIYGASGTLKSADSTDARTAPPQHPTSTCQPSQPRVAIDLNKARYG